MQIIQQQASTSAAHYQFLRKLVYEQSQNVLDPSRDYLFETRLARLLRNESLNTLGDLVDKMRVRKDSTLERAVAEAMTINETSFFRDSRPFEVLRTEILPKLIETRRMLRSLRFWSAASSSGQEAYSLTMLLKENYPELNLWKVKIEGTDIASEMVHKAQKGCYHRIEMNRGLPAKNLVRYFDRIGEEWYVKPELREMCNFRVANLSQSLPFNEPFDVILLRNVMLYFSDETRRQLLRNIHRLLAPDGVLMLGSSEQPVEPALWSAVLSGGTCYYRPRRLS
jgi:chemotaxis protein methyltransferase CheR